MIKKIGYPLDKEFAIRAVSLQGAIIDEAIPVAPEYVKSETEKIRQKLGERYKNIQTAEIP
ncbi:hypothetical protein [Nitrosomonas communis]|uniref:hypothetical protein n=1 Tax=Nitrosomonas communis TaxID=44574 RepID=UPI003D2C129C